MTKKAQRIAVQPVPHSWDIEHWPPSVYPHTPNRGRYVVRSHRAELVAMGALVRVGRELVVIGEVYAKFLEKRVERVANYDIAPNLPEHKGD